jgi:hypothetical protein
VPDNKNQHYVPRCLLKPFTLNGDGRAINVFNLSRGRSILNAPVKSQCSRNYFYGRDDLRAEKVLADLEGRFAAVSDKLLAGAPPGPEDKHWLKLFALMQWRRTTAQLAELRRYKASMEDAAYARDLSQKPKDLDDRELMIISMRAGAHGIEYVQDLKVAIFRNQSHAEFVISDNPSVMTNRLHLQRWRDNRFGMSSSGAMFLMPLSPRLSLIAYDGAAYAADRGNDGFVDAKESDVAAFNDFQFLVAEKNLYFSPSQDPDAFPAAAESVVAERTKAAPTTRVLVPDGKSANTYRLALPGEELTERQMLLETTFRYPSPSSWPSKLKMREKVKLFEDGSAVGRVRKVEWLKTRLRRPPA